MQAQRVAGEGCKVALSAQGVAGGLELFCDLIHADALLGEHRAGGLLAGSQILPLQVELILDRLEMPLETGQLRLEKAGIFSQQQALEERLDDLLAVAGHGHRDAQRIANRFMFAQQHIQHDAIDLVVDAIIGDNFDALAWLAIAVDPALALFMPGRVPGQVILRDSVKGMLQVDALAEAIGADQQTPGAPGQISHAALALGRRQLPGHATDFDARQRLAQLALQVADRGDEAAENDRLIVTLEQVLQDGDQAAQLLVILALQPFRLARHIQEPLPLALVLVILRPDVAARHDIIGFGGILGDLIKHSAAADLVDLRLSLRLCRGGAAAQGSCGGGRAGCHRTQQCQGRPPAYPAAVTVVVDIHDLAGITQRPVKEPLVGIA